MNKFWVVAFETYKRNVKNVAFIVMILAPFLLVGISALGGLIGSKFNDTSDIAVISSNTVIRDAFSKQTSLSVNEKIKTEDEAKKALEADTIDGYLVIVSGASSKMDSELSANFISTTSLGGSDAAEMGQILSGIQLGLTTQVLKISPEDAQRLMAQTQVNSQIVEFNDGKMEEKGDNHLALTIAAMGVGMIMYMIILMYAQVVASEVASEKGTRIMEIILSSTTAANHFYGKIMGVFLVILTQVLVYLFVGVGAFFFAKDTAVVESFLKVVSLKDILTGILGFNLLYLLLGVVFCTILAALSGSLVSKSEDAGKAVTPVTLLTVFGFIINTTFGMANPQHYAIKMSSYIPILSSFTMPTRIASGTVSTAGILISLLILVVSIAIFLPLSAGMYKSTALVYGDATMWSTLKKSFGSLRRKSKA